MPHSPDQNNLWQGTIRLLARRVPPTHRPFFPSVFGTLCFVTAWLLIPVFVEAFGSHPFVADAIQRARLVRIAIRIGYCFTAVGTAIGVMLWARVIQLCWADYFNAHEDRHT